MRNISVHPATRFFIAISFLILVFLASLEYKATLVLFAILFTWKIKPLPSQDPGYLFIRLWLIAGVFLFIINCINWQGGVLVNKEGLRQALESFLRIGSIIVVLLWLIRSMRAEELYAMMIDLRVPVKLIYVLFQAIYLIPRLAEKAGEILLAQQARGFVLKGVRNRLKAYVLILSPLFSTMFYEMEENAAVLTAKGLSASGRKTHLAKLSFTFLDTLLVVSILIITIVLLIIIN